MINIKVICLGGDTAITETKWEVGNGAKCDFWHDNWIDPVLLYRWPTFVNCSMNINKVQELLHIDGKWNETLLNSAFGPDLTLRISRLFRDHPTGNDRIIWRHNESKRPCNLLLYEKCFIANNDSIDWDGAWIWKLKCQPRVAVFLWRILNDAIPTGEWLSRWSIGGSYNCFWGCNAIECVDHIFINCSSAKNIIGTAIKNLGLHCTFGCFKDLLQYKKSCIDHKHMAIGQIFASLIYAIWDNRNCLFHSMPTQPASTIFLKAVSYSEYKIRNWEFTAYGQLEPDIVWTPPPRSWLKLNFDGAVLTNGKAGLGYIIRDCFGQLVLAGGKMAFSHAITRTEINAALLGLVEGSALACNYDGLHIEGDCLEAINRINFELWGEAYGRTEKEIAFYLAKFKHVVNHISRDANKCADFISKLALYDDICMVRGMPLPSELVNLICLDWDVF